LNLRKLKLEFSRLKANIFFVARPKIELTFSSADKVKLKTEQDLFETGF
jgi:hypothetical protein